MYDFDADPELTRAALPQAVLAVLRDGENHGYVIAESLTKATRVIVEAG